MHAMSSEIGLYIKLDLRQAVAASLFDRAKS